jgi:hypothetical protein
MTPAVLDGSPLLVQAMAEVMEESARRIDRRGFAQKMFWDPDTNKYCMRGMITQVVFERYLGLRTFPDGIDVWGAIIDGCDLVLSTQLGTGVAVWNDEPGRTTDEVVRELTKAADECRAKVAA